MDAAADDGLEAGKQRGDGNDGERDDGRAAGSSLGRILLRSSELEEGLATAAAGFRPLWNTGYLFGGAHGSWGGDTGRHTGSLFGGAHEACRGKEEGATA